MAATELRETSPVATDPLRHYRHYQDSAHGPSPYAGGSSFMERVSEAVASGMGTVAFLLLSSSIILAWVLANHVVHFLSLDPPQDPATSRDWRRRWGCRVLGRSLGA
jgi:uncharacterized membrane protein